MLNLEDSIAKIRSLTSEQKVIVSQLSGKIMNGDYYIYDQIIQLNKVVDNIIAILNMHNHLPLENNEEDKEDV